MRDKWLGVIFRTLLISGGILLGYVGFIVLRTNHNQQLIEQRVYLVSLRTNLVENRLAIVGLTKLDSNSQNLNTEKSDLVSKVEGSIKRGEVMLSELNPSLEKTIKTNKEWQRRINLHKLVYEKQREMLDNLYQKQTFEEGLEYLQSEPVINLLVMETNLIYEYDYAEQEIRERLWPIQ